MLVALAARVKRSWEKMFGESKPPSVLDSVKLNDPNATAADGANGGVTASADGEAALKRARIDPPPQLTSTLVAATVSVPAQQPSASSTAAATATAAAFGSRTPNGTAAAAAIALSRSPPRPMPFIAANLITALSDSHHITNSSAGGSSGLLANNNNHAFASPTLSATPAAATSIPRTTTPAAAASSLPVATASPFSGASSYRTPGVGEAGGSGGSATARKAAKKALRTLQVGWDTGSVADRTIINADLVDDSEAYYKEEARKTPNGLAGVMSLRARFGASGAVAAAGGSRRRAPRRTHYVAAPAGLYSDDEDDDNDGDDDDTAIDPDAKSEARQLDESFERGLQIGSSATALSATAATPSASATPGRYQPPHRRTGAAAAASTPTSVLFSSPQQNGATNFTNSAFALDALRTAAAAGASTALTLTLPPSAASAVGGSVLSKSALQVAVDESLNIVAAVQADTSRELKAVAEREQSIADIVSQIAALEPAKEDEDDDADAPSSGVPNIFRAIEQRMKGVDHAPHKKTPLTAAERARVASILAERADRLVVDAFNQSITTVLLRCLASSGWLNDEVVNFYMAMLDDRQKRNAALAAKNPNFALAGTPHKNARLKCWFQNSFFYTKLYETTKHNPNPTYNYGNVKRWSKKAKINIFELDRMLIPVHVGHTHWTLAVIDFTAKQFKYYDSLKGQNPMCFVNLRRYVCDEAAAYNNNPKYDLSDWKDITVDDLPMQNNYSDCGVFTIKFADYLGEDRPLTFDYRNMSYFRERVLLEILQQRVD